MPRSVSGVYTLPNPPVVTNTTIASTDENTTRSDIASEITNSLDRSGRGGMLAPLQLVDGTPSLPGLTFCTDVNTGIYRIGADIIGFAVGGVLSFTIAAAGVTTPSVLTPLVDAGAAALELRGTVGGGTGQMLLTSGQGTGWRIGPTSGNINAELQINSSGSAVIGFIAFRNAGTEVGLIYNIAGAQYFDCAGYHFRSYVDASEQFEISPTAAATS